MTRQAHSDCSSRLRCALAVLMLVALLPACSTTGTPGGAGEQLPRESRVTAAASGERTINPHPVKQASEPEAEQGTLEPRLVGLWACRSSSTRRQQEREIIWSTRWVERFGADGSRYSRIYVGLSISGMQGVYAIVGNGYWFVRGQHLLSALPEADVAPVSDTLLTRQLSYPDNARASLAEQQDEVWSIVGAELRRYDYRNGVYSVCEKTDSHVVDIPSLPPSEPTI